LPQCQVGLFLLPSLNSVKTQLLFAQNLSDLQKHYQCRELTTLWVARLDDGTELKVTDPKEQQGDVEEEETEGEERRDGVDSGRQWASC